MKHFRIGGAPLHPLTVHFPIAAWTSALLADFAFYASGNPIFWTIGYWALALGILTALFSVATGMLDLFGLRDQEEAKKAALQHLMVVGVAWMVFLLALLTRRSAVPESIAVWQIVINAVGMIVLLVGGHLGARLVYVHGAGVQSEE